MKIKTKVMPYEQVMALPTYAHEKPKKQSRMFRGLVHWLAFFDLMRVRFKYKKIGMDKLDSKQPCLILMNHSCFTDLEIVARIFYDRSYHIVCTQDALIGKKWLMKMLGCIPTTKFVTDATLVRNMVHTVKNLKSSIIMFPEAGYSFDGTATVLPKSLGKCVKLLKIPVVMVRTYGAFSRNPLYNELQVRKTNISAEVEFILSPEEIKAKTADEINRILREQFSFDGFRWQQENKISIKEKFRADGLNRVLYKCPHCGTEGKMQGKGIHLTCTSCGKQYELTEYGYLQATDGESKFTHVPDWNQWQRECVREEILDGKYCMDVPVDVYMMIDTKGLYKVGAGNLVHSSEGFHLTGCDGKLDYRQGVSASYCLNSDFYWYEIGDVIGIGDKDRQYYCFPKVEGDIVAKARLAAEELYKLHQNR